MGAGGALGAGGGLPAGGALGAGGGFPAGGAVGAGGGLTAGGAFGVGGGCTGGCCAAQETMRTASTSGRSAIFDVVPLDRRSGAVGGSESGGVMFI